MTNQAKLPSIEEIISAYEASTGHSRQVLQATLISSIPKIRKWILEYLVTHRLPDGQIKEESIIGKIYSDEEKGLASFRFLQYLWKNGFADDPRYTVVRPIAFLQNWKMLLMSKASGKTMDDWLYDPMIDGKRIASLAANWLTRMHAIPLTKVRASIRTRANADLKRFYEELAALIPEEKARLKSIYDQCLQKSSLLSKDQSILLHGDFHPKNIFIDDQKVTAIDFDHHFVGDAAWDVAYLACQIQISSFFKKGDFHYFQPVVKHFIDAYLQAHPSYNQESFMERLALYSARSLFESLHYELCVLKTGKVTILDPFLRMCQRYLQGNGLK
jgi:thiamine kinase-like enzyme